MSLVLIWFPAQATDLNPFDVDGVEIYAESDSLDNARREAVNKGTQEAFVILLKRLIPSSMHWKIDNIKRDQIFDLVSDTKVIKERMTSKTYMATISVSFKPEEIRNILNKIGANYAGEYALSALVIPILNIDGNYQIWGDNEWAKAWGQMPLVIGLSKYSFAMGDLEDDADIDQLQVMKEPFSHYKKILEKYHADQIIFVMTKELNTAFDTSVRIVSQDDDVTLHSMQKFNSKTGDADLYKNFALNILTKIDDYYKGVNPFDENRTFKTRMVASTISPKDWADMRAKLITLKEIEDIQTIATTNEYVEFDLIYKIEPLDMSAALAKHNFEVSEEGDIQYLKEIKSK